MPKIVGSGRKQAIEWQEVTRTSNSCRVKCKYCQTLLSSKIERVRAHLNTCKRRGTIAEEKSDTEAEANESAIDVLPSTSSACVGNTSMSNTCATTPSTEFTTKDLSNISAFFLPKSSKSLPVASTSKTCNSGDRSKISNQLSPISSSTPKKKKMIHPNLTNFAFTTSAAQKKDIDSKIAKFFYGNSIAFRAADSQQYKDMVKSLRPGYTPPSRKDLAGQLLDNAHDSIEGYMKEMLADATITLMQDGWSSVKNDPIIGTALHNGNKSFLLSTHDCGADKKTADYCFQLATENIDHVKEVYGKEVS